MKMFVGKQSGFTLVKLVVVIGILAILSSVSIVGNQFINNARTSRARTELSIVQRLVEAQYYVDSFEYTEAGSEATVSYEPLTDTFTVTYDGAVGSNEKKIADAISAAINAAQDNDELAQHSVNDPSAEGFIHTDDDPKLYVYVTKEGDDYNLVMVYFTGSGGSLEWTGLQIEVEGT
jgi:Tfp pilus assembly protein PilE